MPDPTPTDIAYAQLFHATKVAEWQTRNLYVALSGGVVLPAFGYALALSEGESDYFVGACVLAGISLVLRYALVRAPDPDNAVDWLLEGGNASSR